MQEIPMGGQRRLSPQEVHGGMADGLQTDSVRRPGGQRPQVARLRPASSGLWLQKTDSDRAWSELPIKTAPEVQAFFRASTFYRVGDGRTALF